jgi:hypothetical protein
MSGLSWTQTNEGPAGSNLSPEGGASCIIVPRGPGPAPVLCNTDLQLQPVMLPRLRQAAGEQTSRALASESGAIPILPS